MDTTDIVKQLTDWVGAIWGLPVRVVLFVLLVGVAQLLKKSPHIDNWAIPWIVTILGGMGAWFILSEVPSAAATPKGNIMTGCVSGFIAHLLHYKILANPQSKVPMLGGILCGSGDSNPSAFVKGKDGIFLEPNNPPESNDTKPRLP